MIEIMLAGGGSLQVEYSEFTRITTSGSGTITPPVGAKAMRMAAIGRGGKGHASYSTFFNNELLLAGGGGGGCAASSIFRVPNGSIAYHIGSITRISIGGSTALTAYEGQQVTSRTGLVGSRTEGGQGGSFDPNTTHFAYGYTGGRGGLVESGTTASPQVATGGGAAGPSGNGGNGGAIYLSSSNLIQASNGELSSDGWGVGGGSGGYVYYQTSSSYKGTGGAGAGSTSGMVVESSTPQNLTAGTVWGLPSSNVYYLASSFTSAVLSGGEMGGGGTGVHVPSTSAYSGEGGAGGIVIEWFF